VEIREGGDSGVPVVMSNPKNEPAMAFTNLANSLRDVLF